MKRSYARFAYRQPRYITSEEVAEACKIANGRLVDLGKFIPCRYAGNIPTLLACYLHSSNLRIGPRFTRQFYAPHLILILEKLGLSPSHHARMSTWTDVVIRILDVRSLIKTLPGEEEMRLGVARELCRVDGPSACLVYADWLEEHGVTTHHIADLRTLAIYGSNERKAGRSVYYEKKR